MISRPFPTSSHSLVFQKRENHLIFPKIHGTRLCDILATAAATLQRSTRKITNAIVYQLSDSFEIQKRKTAFSSIEVLAMKNPVQVPLKNSMFLSLSLCAEEEGTGLTFSQEVVLKGLQICDMKEEV